MIANKKQLMEKVDEVISLLRPYLIEDGGDMELVDITDAGVAKVRLLGACGMCSMSTMTLKAGVEAKVKELVPEIVAIEELI